MQCINFMGVWISVCNDVAIQVEDASLVALGGLSVSGYSFEQHPEMVSYVKQVRSSIVKILWHYSLHCSQAIKIKCQVHTCIGFEISMVKFSQCVLLQMPQKCVIHHFKQDYGTCIGLFIYCVQRYHRNIIHHKLKIILCTNICWASHVMCDIPMHAHVCYCYRCFHLMMKSFKRCTRKPHKNRYL